ncbi:unnamed protein product [Blepharisma stoltei]|uniref:Uncharacterized protein n=1 Tax=Blepharisma stoltei TaxID=1481888 RepID=A0AAU9JK04_9CILI|nr:unnamed protein product [Blepharisma stoltei]
MNFLFCTKILNKRLKLRQLSIKTLNEEEFLIGTFVIIMQKLLRFLALYMISNNLLINLKYFIFPAKNS